MAKAYQAYQAYGSGPEAAVGTTPRQAAMLYFWINPERRKCCIVEGTYAAGCFTIDFGTPNPPEFYKDITKARVIQLPDT